LLTSIGLTSSNSEAQRKLKEGAVSINGRVWTKPSIPIEQHHFLPNRREARLVIRLGKREKAVILE
jgi:tyrosyl-tRNA synthetase